MNQIAPVQISEIFDRVVVVNLARRPERMERFWNLLSDWPFKKPERFEAVDGEAAGVPAGWDKGAGAWGCLLSHRALMDRAIADGVGTLLVLEDDAIPVANFGAMAGEFLRSVPADWDGLMLGAEHLREPEAVRAGVVRCVSSNRTHAYAVRGKFMQTLSQFWHNTTNDHCDIVLSSLMRHFKVYAPDPLLIGQDAGHSDITGRREYLRFLNGAQKETIAGADPKYLIEKLVVRVSVKGAPKTAQYDARQVQV
ncbi:MAG TPA: glycosyltransferase family 25 protein [Tepidisphaeraceae bacterium]|jgi:GR25 family glycosyltransferase involved in LPS biosynthesis